MRTLRILMILLLIVLVAVGCNSSPPITDGPGRDPGSTQPPLTDPQPEEPGLPAAFMVMVDNSSKARPQHGLSKADVVYEIISEAAVTRLMAAFYSRDPGFVGPVRSIRYYYLHVNRANNIPLAHVGGGQNALDLRAPLGIKSVCAITNAGAAFYTDPQRRSPHNTYVTSESILGVASRRGYSSVGLPELPQGEFAGTQPANEVQLTYSSSYKVGWVYQPEEENYLRLVNGVPHPTAEADEITAGTIIVIEAAVKTVEVPINGIQSEINLLGQGKALFLRDGQMASGTWRKDKPESHFVYRLDDGTELTYAPGSVWIQQIPSISRNVVTE